MVPSPPNAPSSTFCSNTDSIPHRKIPWRLSKYQKARQRRRLRAVDNVVSIVDQALAKAGITTKAVERWKEEMPIEQEMMPKDKYTIFDRKEKKYRKSIRSELSAGRAMWKEMC